LKTINDKFWSISRKNTENDLTEESLFNKYEVKIFNTFKLQEDDRLYQTFNLKNENQNNKLNDEMKIDQENSDNNNDNNQTHQENNTEKIRFFNHTNQEVILLDNKLKNFALTIKQISFIKNEKIRNRALFMLLSTSYKIISNEQLMNFNRKLIDENANGYLTNNNTSMSRRNYLRECEGKKDLINRNAILKRIFSENFQTDNLIQYIHNLIHESFSNQIISLGYIKNENLDSICVIRDNGVGFIRYIWDFQKINETIHYHETKIREFIFTNKNINKFGFEIKNNNSFKQMMLLQNKILNYFAEQNKISEENSLLICLALLRILFVENYIKINDYNYFVDYFNDEIESKNFSDFIDDHFGEVLQKENNMLFLDIFNSIISQVFKNNQTLILKIFDDMISMFDNYSNSDIADKINQFSVHDNFISKPNSGPSFVSASSTNKYDFKFYYKFCEIIKKITQDKIEALFFISRDITSFSKWIEIYHHDFDKNYKGNFDIGIFK
jgi:hypothetical protein